MPITNLEEALAALKASRTREQVLEGFVHPEILADIHAGRPVPGISARGDGRVIGGTVDRLTRERDEWKRRAEKHGCNVVDGDPDCG